MPESVIVVGGGLGGLCLASGLCQGGLRVTVFERDLTASTRGQGYRLHLDHRGDDALRECLPTSAYALHRATCGPPSSQFSVLTKRLRTLRVVPTGGFGAGGTSVDRSTLRAVLVRGLEGVVRFGEEFTGYELLANGKVRAHFAGGATRDADVLVGADGVNSVVRKQFLPEASLVDTDAQVVYGKTLLTPQTWPLVPDVLHKGFAAVTAWPRHHGMALGLMRFSTPPEHLGLPAVADYLMWGFTAPPRDFGHVPELVRGWHPSIRALVDRCEPDETFTVRVRHAGPIGGWGDGPVTLLGDAVHAMPPSRGSGANLALRDAARLCRRLLAAHRGEVALRTALDDYEEVMVREGFAEVAASVRAPGEWFRRSRRPAG
jgi:2-polyprenyl-6-methoxyphenol hydroxylase-like FAD-dependent oxidoreductase